MDQFQSDRIVIAAFVSVLVGFVTAVLSIVRLVNDKESKTTDYRQGWTDSLRTCVADLISNINTLAGEVVRRLDSIDKVNGLRTEVSDFDEKDKALHDHLIKAIADHDSHIRDLRQKMYQSYALTRLHFKPNDETFTPLENKFDVIVENINKLEKLIGPVNLPDRIVVRERVFADVMEITGYARFILKTTWETVKRGEKAYELTKKWSFRGGAFALIILLSFGLFAALNAWKHAGELPGNKNKPLPVAQSPNESAITSASTMPSPTQRVTVVVGDNCPAARNNNIVPAQVAKSKTCQ